MNMQEVRKLGGAVMAARQREQALARYYTEPNTCLGCGEVISVPPGKKVAHVRSRLFCGQRCAAKHNNAKRPRKLKERHCQQCGFVLSAEEARTRRRALCDCCLAGKFLSTSGQKKTDVGRTSIASHARTVLREVGRAAVCGTCGYSKFVEVAHVKAVSEFPADALVAEINAESNLIYLCPNCHWELDHPVQQ
jgi:hypothetical protein